MALMSDAIAVAARPSRWRAALGAWLELRAARRELLDCQALDRRFARDIGLTPEELAYIPLKGWPQRSWYTKSASGPRPTGPNLPIG